MKQREAQRLADANDKCAKAWLESSDAHKFRKDTAAELRRPDEANRELLEALNRTVCNFNRGDMNDGEYKAIQHARAAIAKHGGQQ